MPRNAMPLAWCRAAAWRVHGVIEGAVFLAASAYMLGALAVIRRAFAMFPMAAASFF